MKVKLTPDQKDAVVVKALKEHYIMNKNPSSHPQDVVDAEVFSSACNVLLRYFMLEEEAVHWLNENK